MVLQGLLQDKYEPFVQVLGVTVDTSTGFTFEIDSVVNPVDSTTFFNTVVVGDLVELKGTWVAGLLSWDSVELDD